MCALRHGVMLRRRQLLLALVALHCRILYGMLLLMPFLTNTDVICLWCRYDEDVLLPLTPVEARRLPAAAAAALAAGGGAVPVLDVTAMPGGCEASWSLAARPACGFLTALPPSTLRPLLVC